MKYANTVINNGVEVVLVTLPLEMVPAFDPSQPPPQAYAVDDEVQPGWIKQPDGTFRAPTAADQPAQPVPQRVTAYQAKAALMDAGYYNQIEDFVASAACPPRVGLAWREALHFERNDDKIYLIARNVLFFTESQLESRLDSLFIAANAIK